MFQFFVTYIIKTKFLELQKKYFTRIKHFLFTLMLHKTYICPYPLYLFQFFLYSIVYFKIISKAVMVGFKGTKYAKTTETHKQLHKSTHCTTIKTIYLYNVCTLYSPNKHEYETVYLKGTKKILLLYIPRKLSWVNHIPSNHKKNEFYSLYERVRVYKINPIPFIKIPLNYHRNIHFA